LILTREYKRHPQLELRSAATSDFTGRAAQHPGGGPSGLSPPLWLYVTMADREPEPDNKPKRIRHRTSTSAFGVSKRESHDASRFYERFATPVYSDDDTVVPCPVPDSIHCADSRSMSFLPDSCIALMVTSPPYFSGKEYELAMGQGVVPASYREYLDMLRDVFAESLRVLEPGGRMAVNVANLGRKPYRSLSADVIGILQNDLRMLLRGEILWIKARGASGSCAWGSWMSGANPVLRDLSERIIVASKGRLDRAIPQKKRAEMGLPYEDTISRELFMECTLDTWFVPPESAKRVGHPAPFPVELPRRLIEMFSYKDDCVLDPFAGAGSTALAARYCGRHFVLVDNEQKYCDLAQQRLNDAANNGKAPGDLSVAQ
jgi:DNA modification methylase